MSAIDDYYAMLEEQKKKKLSSLLGSNTSNNNNIAVTTRSGNAIDDYYAMVEDRRQRNLPNIAQNVGIPLASDEEEEDDIAPVKEEDEGLLDFFQKSRAFEDGYDRWDVSKTILGTVGDAGLGIVKGFGQTVEGVADLLGYGMAGVASAIGQDKFASNVKEAVKENTIQELAKPATEFLDKYSVLGRTSDAVAEGVGQIGLMLATGGLGAASGLGTVGTTALTTGLMGASGMGSGMGEAYQGGATDKEALTYGAIAGAADALSELIFGGLGKAVNAVGFNVGLSSADDLLAKKVSGLLTNQIAKNFAEFGIKAGAEGFEEVLAGTAQGIAKYFTYMDDKELGEILKDENLLEQFVVGAVTSGITQVGVIPGTKQGSLIEANKTGRDFITGMTQDEQKVIDKVYEDRLAEAQKKGNLTGKEKSKLYDRVVEDMDKGYISIDTIEEVLGGESLKTYQDTVANEDAQIKQIEDQLKELEEAPNTVGNAKKYDALQNQLEELKKNSKRDQLKTKWSEDVKGLIQGSRLMESYNEVERHKQRIKVDLNQYQDPNARKTAENLAKVLDNSNKAHDVLNLMTKVSEDRGVSFTPEDAQKFEGTIVGIKRVKNFTADGKSTEYDIGSTNLNTEFKPVVTVDNQVVDSYTVDFKTGKITFETAPTGEISVEFRKDARVNGKLADGTIAIDMKSKKYLESLVGHEITHTLENTEFYNKLQEYIFEYAKKKGDFDSRYQKLADLYNGIEGTSVEAELTAELVGDYLFQDSDFIMNLSTNHRNVFQKIFDEIKYLYKAATAGSEQAKRLEQVKKAFETAWRETAKVQKNTAENSGGKYSLLVKDKNGNVSTVNPYVTTKEQTKDYMVKARKGELDQYTYFPVSAHTPGTVIATLNNAGIEITDKPLAMQAKKARQSQIEGQHTESDGTVVRHHAMSTEEIQETIDKLNDPFAVIHQTERTKTVQEDGRKIRVPAPDNFVFFVKLDSGKETVAVIEFDSIINEEMIQKDGQGDEFHTTVTVFEPDKYRNGNAFDYLEYLAIKPSNIELEVTKSSETETAISQTEATVSESELSDAKVAQEEPIVKGQFSLSDTSGRQLSNEQAEYFKDSQVVDENGNLKIMYHGTPNGDFTVFKDGTYFTDNKAYADRYQNPGASSIRSGKTASNPKTFEVYLDIKKPFDLSDAEARRIYIEDYIKGGNAMGINPYLSDAEYDKINTIDWTEGEDLREFLIDNGYDYDGLVLDEGADGGYGDDVRSRGKSYVVFSPEQVKNVDNQSPTSDPDIRFSLSEAVEETNDLMAIHNLHTNEVLKQLEMGGMPYPSVAITKPAEIAHEDFGEISLILNKDAIDPKKSSYNHIYSSDAYTPTFPHVSYEASRDAAESIIARVNEQFENLPDYYRRSLSSLRDYHNLNDVLDRSGGAEGLVERFANDHGMKQLYLAEKGETVPVQINRTETQMTDYQKAMAQKVIDRLGVDVLNSFNDKGDFYTLGRARLAWVQNHAEAIKDIYAEDWSSDGTMTKEEALEIANEQKLVYWRNEVMDTLKFMENGGLTVVEKEDFNATNSKIDEQVDDSAYRQWLANLFSGIEGQSGIRNNKDTFTPRGMRRSFAQLHDPVTIDNVIKAMRKKEQTGQGAFGTSNFGGAAVQEYGSIAEAKRNANMLGTIGEAEYKAIKQRIDDRLLDIALRYANGKDIIDAKGAIVEAVARSESKAGIVRYLKQYDYVFKFSDDIADDIIELRDYVRSLPRPYFEAKPRRAVGFDEVAVFVIPYDADVKLKQELLNRGYSIAEYDPKVEGDRQRVLNQFEEYKFSLSDAAETPKKYGDRATLGEEVLYKPTEEIAPVAENATTRATVSEKESVEDLFPDDLAPIQEEYEFLVAERDDIRGAMDAYAAVGDTNGVDQLMPEYEAVQARIAEIESEDADRLASIDEADAPQEVDNTPENMADDVPLTKTLVTELAKNVRSQLGLPAKRVAEVRELIEWYSAQEFPSKALLYTEIEERFGKLTETYVDEDLKGVKSLLRTYGINVSDSIKRDIADYGQAMKSNFGKVRFAKDGLPVDVAYQEFQSVLPGLFPERIYVPSDQLLRIIEVANMDTIVEQEYEIDWETLVEATDTIANGVNEFKQNRKEALANKHGRESFNSLMESADQYVPPIPENIAPVKTRPAVQADPDDIAPVFETSSGQQAFMPEAEVPKKVTRKELHENIVDNIRTNFRENGFDFDEILKNAKDLSTFATVDNTPQRVMEKALGYKAGQILGDLTVNQVAQNESKGIRWLNSFTDKKSGLLAKISKQYNIKPGSKASAAAQMYAEGFYVGENNAIIEYGDRELAADFPDAKVQANIKKLARDPRIRQIYDETLAAINESRARNAYPEIPRLDNYFLHFRAMEDTFSKIGLPFNPNDIRAKDLPTDLNGVTADLKPGQPYFASAKHRTGKRTSFDLLGGLENYLTSAKNQIYHIDDIQKLRALRNYVAETYGQAHGLENLDTMSNEEAEQRIEEVYNSHLSTFAKFLNEEANVLAGKTSLIDRGLEGVIGRRGITFLDTLNRQVGANMVGFNVSSSLTNLIAPVQAFAKSNKYDFVRAIAQTASNKIGSIFGKGDTFVEDSPVMIRRKGAERFYRTPYQKVADTGYVFMSMVDDLSTELIARTKYNELTRNGMDSQQAHYETDKWVSRLMGDRSLGQQPQLYNSKMLGLFTKFQLEVRNQLDSQFYDTIQEAKVSTEEIENKLLRNAKKAAKITSTFAQLAVLQHLFGKAFESVAGYNPAFDIIDALIKTFGWDDEEDDEDTVLDNIEEGFLSLLGDLPYTSTLTGGRIPIASALPVTELIKGEDQYGNEKSRWDTLGEAAPYYLLPGGYGQIKKTMAGMKMFSDEHPVAGSYTDSGNLRFPVEDTIGNRVQAGIFGQWASENARDYFDNERKPLKENQIEEFLATGMKIQEYWDYREGLSEHETLEEKVDYIAGLDLPVSTKNVLVNNVLDRKESINLADYDQYGGLEEMDFAVKNPEKYEVAVAMGGYDRYMAYQEDMKDMKLAQKADYIASLPLSVEQKNLLINSETDRKEPIDLTGYENYSNFEEFEYAQKNPGSYALAKSVGGYETYMEYSEALGNIESDKDEWGESIRNSRKPKVEAYIYSLDIPDIEKHILFKSEYTSFDDYNYQILEYLDNREDISWEEMVAILQKLDFKVAADGTIRW